MWVRQGRTDAWIAHKLDVSVDELGRFKREHALDENDETARSRPADPLSVPPPEAASTFEDSEEEEEDEEDDAEVVERERSPRRRSRRGRGRRPARSEASNGGEDEEPADAPDVEDDADDEEEQRAPVARDGADRADRAEPDGDAPRRRRRGRRGGRRHRTRRTAYEATFDHGGEGYGLWLDPAVVDNPVYSEHWAGHRAVTVTFDAETITIRRARAAEDGDAGRESGEPPDDG
jgi:hypothetical protein